MKYDTPEGIRAGDVFGMLTVKEFAGRNARYQAKFVAACECGGSVEVLGTNLKMGNTTRCNSGRHRIDHGMVDTPEYLAWKSMNYRVKSKRSKDRPHYLDRGICVCPEWCSSFVLFLEHIGPMPHPGLEIDRINNDGNYEPGNVRWATRTQQMRNRTNTVKATINGVEKPLTQWAEESGIHVNTLLFRLRRKWPESELLSLSKWKHRVGRCA